MCGIAGFNLSKEDRGRIDSRTLAAGLLNRIVIRGRDATGAAWNDSNEIWYYKSPVAAEKFINNNLHLLPYASSNVILHTRWATQGSPSIEQNNHPIVVPGITGVHNGHINNDREIIEWCGGDREGEVDSEAAFRLIAHFGDLSYLRFVEGRAALAWIPTENPGELHLARLTGSPLAIGQTANGSTIFASTEDLLISGCMRAGIKLCFSLEVEEWTYIRVQNGVIHDWSLIS